MDHPSLIDRDYQRYVHKGNTDVCYLRHPSGVVVVTLSRQHKAFQTGIRSLDWRITRRNKENDRSKQTVRGKSKKGGLVVYPETKLCIITSNDGTIHPVRAGINASLIEVNDLISKSPDLLCKSPENRGFIAILMPHSAERGCVPKNFHAI